MSLFNSELNSTATNLLLRLWDLSAAIFCTVHNCITSSYKAGGSGTSQPISFSHAPMFLQCYKLEYYRWYHRQCHQLHARSDLRPPCPRCECRMWNERPTLRQRQSTCEGPHCRGFAICSTHIHLYLLVTRRQHTYVYTHLYLMVYQRLANH